MVFALPSTNGYRMLQIKFYLRNLIWFVLGATLLVLIAVRFTNYGHFTQNFGSGITRLPKPISYSPSTILAYEIANVNYQTIGSRVALFQLASTTSNFTKQKISPDILPPAISEVQINSTVKGSGSEGYGEVQVTWKTNEPATSLVEYGKGSNVKIFSSRTTENTDLKTDHMVIISGLSTSSIYSFRPISRDKINNYSTGTQQPIIIERAPDNLLSILLIFFKKIFGF